MAGVGGFDWQSCALMCTPFKHIRTEMARGADQQFSCFLRGWVFERPSKESCKLAAVVKENTGTHCKQHNTQWPLTWVWLFMRKRASCTILRWNLPHFGRTVHENVPWYPLVAPILDFQWTCVKRKACFLVCRENSSKVARFIYIISNNYPILMYYMEWCVICVSFLCRDLVAKPYVRWSLSPHGEKADMVSSSWRHHDYGRHHYRDHNDNNI